MVLIGTMNLTRTIDRGHFYCPTCRANHPYRLRSRRPFLTIYFIPTVPVGGAERFVLCEGCKSSWDESVLAITQETMEEAEEEQFREDALRCAVLVTIADGTITEGEIDALMMVSNQMLQHPVTRDELGQICSSAQRVGINAKNFIVSAKNRWSESQRHRVLQAAFLAASADGELNKSQLAFLADLRDMFELTDEQYQGLIEDALTYL